MNPAYFSAAVPEPFRILGLTLKPLSIGRYRLLRRFNVGFAAEEEYSITGADLILGLLICSMRCDEFIEWSGSKSFARDVRRWGAKIMRWPWVGFIPLVGKWWRKYFAFDLGEKARLFSRYVEEARAIPPHTVEGDAGDGSSVSDWTQNIEIALRSELGWTGEEIQEAPLSKAIADYFTFAESQGLIRFISEEEEQLGRENAAIFEKAFKSGNN